MMDYSSEMRHPRDTSNPTFLARVRQAHSIGQTAKRRFITLLPEHK